MRAETPLSYGRGKIANVIIIHTNLLCTNIGPFSQLRVTLIRCIALSGLEMSKFAPQMARVSTKIPQHRNFVYSMME